MFFLFNYILGKFNWNEDISIEYNYAKILFPLFIKIGGKKIMKLLVVRHGRTDWNDQGKIQGCADIELNQTGINQAKETAKKLQNEKIDLIIASPLIRTKQTAQIINEGRNIDIIYDERVRERDFGEFEGLKRDEFDYFGYWTYSKNYKYEKAENIQDFFKRIFGFLDDIKEKYKDKTVLLVSHAGVSTAIKYYFEELPKENEMTSGRLNNCEVREYYL